MKWPEFVDDDPERQAKRRQANGIQGMVVDRWRSGYFADTSELRKADGRVIPISGRENKNG